MITRLAGKFSDDALLRAISLEEFGTPDALSTDSYRIDAVNVIADPANPGEALLEYNVLPK